MSLVNCSLRAGIFPYCMEIAAIRPLLKKNNRDPSSLNNYRPISNLTLLSKIIEKIVYQQLNRYLTDNNIYDKFQFGFSTSHSTETAFLKVVNDMRINSDNKETSVLILLDLSSEFNTVDHGILLEKLRSWLGRSGTVPQWFESYLHNLNFIVTLGHFHSNKYELVCGVPQGSILGCLLFNLYMLSLGYIISKHSISYHTYVNDTQPLISLSTDDFQSINSLGSCLEKINH